MAVALLWDPASNQAPECFYNAFKINEEMFDAHTLTRHQTCWVRNYNLPVMRIFSHNEEGTDQGSKGSYQQLF